MISCIITPFFVLVFLRDDLALPEERRRKMFEVEARATLSEEVDAAAAKTALEVGPFFLSSASER